MSEQASTDTRRPRGRSPSYPAIHLEQAIQRARQIYDRERQHPTPVETIVQHWGYKSLNGPASLSLAALKKFGLIADEGTGSTRRARISDLAVHILANPDERERTRAIREAALNPAIHRELWARYGSQTPSDVNLKWELTREHKFTDTGADEFIPEYRATIAFAQLAVDDSVQTQTPDSGSDDNAEDESPPPPPPGRQPRQRRVTTETSSAYTIPLVGGASIVFEGEFPITEREWTHLMAVLDVLKPGLVVSRDQGDNTD